MIRWPFAEQRIGRNLRESRVRANKTQDDVARVLKLARPAVSRIEHGRQSLTVAQAVALAAWLDISLERFEDGCPIGY